VKEGGLGSYAKRIKELLDSAAADPEAFSRLAGVQAKVEQVRVRPRGVCGRERGGAPAL
jgi:hypothetical protein